MLKEGAAIVTVDITQEECFVAHVLMAAWWCAVTVDPAQLIGDSEMLRCGTNNKILLLT